MNVPVLALRIVVSRDWFLPDRTLSTVSLVLPGETELKAFGFCLEDVDRRVEEDPGRKVQGRTAIPTGTYKVHLYDSPKHGPDTPELLDVPGFRHIQIHSGNLPEHTEGCLLMGLARTGAQVTRSRPACTWLRGVIIHTIQRGGEVTVEVRRAK